MAFENLSEKLSSAFKRLKNKGKLSESDIKEAMREVRFALLEADVSYKVVKDFIAKATESCIGEEVFNSLTPAQQVIKIVNENLVELMGKDQSEIKFNGNNPFIIMMCGLQGSGKTTHSAKLAKYLIKKGKRPMLVACDVYRPAAIEQLKVVGGQVGAKVFELGNKNPVEIAKKAVAEAKIHGNDVVILDTAGRLHIDNTLMDELKQIDKTVSPDEILLVVDSMTGQDAVNVAKAFNEALEIDGVILTKLDGDTRGGAALSVLAVTGKPIKFSGIGEKLEDLEVFHPERMASRILGMGDVLTLIEKVSQNIDQEEALKLEQKFKKNEFDLNDLLSQMKQIQKMGSMKDLIKMIPGVGDKLKDVDVDERQFSRLEALITSMTPKEREKPSIINPSRKRRIANGSGSKVEDVNRLLKQFEQMQKMMKQMGKGKGKGKFKGMGLPF
jgi:signal recognition particle subunit SRP54